MPDPKKPLFDDDDEQSDKTEHSNPGDLPFKPREDQGLKDEDDEATVIAPPEKKKGR